MREDRIGYLKLNGVLFSDALQQGASQFEQQAGKLKRKYWWKNLKVRILIFLVLVRNKRYTLYLGTVLAF
jgi:hypothetical protein